MCQKGARADSEGHVAVPTGRLWKARRRLGLNNLFGALRSGPCGGTRWTGLTGVADGRPTERRRAPRPGGRLGPNPRERRRPASPPGRAARRRLGRPADLPARPQVSRQYQPRRVLFKKLLGGPGAVTAEHFGSAQSRWARRWPGVHPGAARARGPPEEPWRLQRTTSDEHAPASTGGHHNAVQYLLSARAWAKKKIG